MNQDKLTIRNLNATIEDIATRFSRLAPDDRFVLWFFRAYITDSEERAAEAVAGGSRDKGIDGLLIDDAARAVFIVQAKYRKALMEKAEKRDDVISFAQVAAQLCCPSNGEFREYVTTMESYSAERFEEARKRVVGKKYRVILYFATLGKISSSIRKDAENVVRSADGDAKVEFFDGHRAMLLFRDYLDGVAPPIPSLDLEMEKGPNVTVNSIAQRYDEYAHIESWVFPMRGGAVASLYESAGTRIFARNIRGYLGPGKKKDVNRSMVSTLSSEPERFFYYNNGITIICDDAVKRSRQGRDILQVSNPQIINGQQTTRVLAEHPAEAQRASVLVKVIRVPREVGHDSDGFELLVSQIVSGTNWQNPITASDLMANDRIQIELERALRKLGYLYIRKRQSKKEAKRSAPGKHYIPVKKQEIAQAVGACELDPAVIMKGTERLFEEDMYTKVFPNCDPNYHLPRYCLKREVAYAVQGDRERKFARWHVLHFVWSHLGPMVRSNRNARSFRVQWEQNKPEVFEPLADAIEAAFEVMLRYYRRTGARGASGIDVSVFFKQAGHHRKFGKFWDSTTRGRRALEKAMSKVLAGIEGFEA